MKSVFVKDGYVIGYGSAYSQGATIICVEPNAVEYQVADDTAVDVGWSCDDVDGKPEFHQPEGRAPKVSPVQFKLLFTVTERVAIKSSADMVVQDFFEIVNDPRLTFVDLALESTQQALAYLESKSLIGKGRPAQILTGIIQ